MLLNKENLRQSLSDAIKRKMRDENLSMRQFALRCGLTQGTICRLVKIAYSDVPDTSTLVKLSDYMNIPVSRLIGDETDSAVRFLPGEAVPDIIDAHLMKDKNLSPDDAKKLSEIFRSAYSGFAALEQENKNNDNSNKNDD